MMTVCLTVCCAFVMTGCRTLRSLPPFDLAEPGWNVRHGQAVWRPAFGAEELAGELMVASHPDGRRFLQFTKLPLPLIVVQMTPDRWRIQFSAENKILSRRGAPPTHLTWLHLPGFLNGTASAPAAAAFEFQGGGDRPWTLLNLETGERIAGYLDP